MSEEKKGKPPTEGKLNHPISRRKFLRDAGLALGGVTLGSSALLASCTRSGAQTDSAAIPVVKYSLYDPSGAVQVSQLFAPRLSALDGKTIAFVSNEQWNFAATFERLSQLLKQKYPTITIINYDKFPAASVDATTWPALQAAIKAARPDAAIIGNAG